MLKKLLPEVVEVQTLALSVQLILQVDADISYFNGHFDNFAILPGVALISWVVHYSAKYLGTSTKSLGLDTIKFLKPVTPNTRIHLWIEKRDDKIEFTCTNGAEKMASGRVLLEPA